MDHLIKKLEECLNEKLLKITVSNPRRAEEIKKYTIRPVLLRNRLAFQVESHTKILKRRFSMRIWKRTERWRN